MQSRWRLHQTPCVAAALKFAGSLAEALQMVQQLFRSRGQRTYFDAVKQPVEEACGRRFTVRNPPIGPACHPDQLAKSSCHDEQL